ncbi:Isoleucine--tRNA ligase [Gossypium arboreum]|uniref:isoleucine--tRNA ligase n=1 Tax=Gossypium arboreum TaxID=29729 RepID=A0A0B0N507_GOSAR|nr:Isoleucine--tRNA ligase [Gossypium arboreum]
MQYPEGHVSRSIYALFRMVSTPSSKDSLLEEFFPDICLAIWTTTPWTVPANAAVAVNAKLKYAVVEAKSLSEDVHLSAGNKKKRLGNIVTEPKMPFFIVASDLVPTLEAKWGIKLIVKKTLSGSDLENCRYIHPINNMECPVVIGGDYITTESGTGLVHTAPGHGQEDYVTGLKYGLPIYSPVDDDGKFTEEAGQFNGLDVLGDGNAAVVKYLDETLSIIMEESYEHKYPYDWRTKKPTIFRATEQWFASVEGFRQAAMDAIGHVKWIPAQAQNRISSMTSSRSDWCISRQRTWGLPIPVFYHVTSREPLMNKETIDHIKSIIAQKGSDAWWYMTVEDLLPEEYCDTASEYEKSTDTMDVWFDSGSSWAAVLGERDCLNFPADLYLEGTDQHRGWFQSSLLTSIATKGKAPYSSVITHGFVLDEKGLKMSKSLGNVVDPHTIIEGGKNQKEAPGYGADIMRLWVSSVDYTGDVMIGPQILRQISDVYRKLRGTLRYLLGNLHDWKVENAVSYQELPMIDRHALFQLENVVKNIREGYENYQFFKIFQLRTEVNKVLEIARTGKLIGSSLEAKVYLHVSDAILASRLLEMCSANYDADALHRIFLTSQVEVVPSLDQELVQNISHTGEYVVEDDRVWIGVSRADGSKCERCWNYSPQVGSFTEHPTLCGRCFNVVGIQPTPAMAAAIS